TFDRLELSFEQINRFSADVSHEIKTPLSLVRLNVERLLREQDITPGGKEALQDAIEEIHHLDKLIERLLFLSRAQAGEVELDWQLHNPREFIDAFLHDGQALAEPQRVVCEVRQNEDGQVRFDSGRMRQVLFNLLANALKASSPGGHINLNSTIHDGRWRVTIEDEGEGLPPEKCEVIFERFVRIKQSTRTPGAGLGLAICRSIIDLHNGKISAGARPEGRGLRILLEIPAAI
ncbi:MAG TPA: HAMP domain-containing sensor histidine kinase, partial [Lacunisphaera sp.]